MEYIQTAGVVVLKNDEVLLVRHTDGASHHTGTVGLPAGRLQENESAKQAALRELYEESGLRTDESSLIQLPNVFPATLDLKGGPQDFMLTVFLCTSYSGELLVSSETEPFWAKILDVEGMQTIGDTKNAIHDALHAAQELIRT